MREVNFLYVFFLFPAFAMRSDCFFFFSYLVFE